MRVKDGYGIYGYNGVSHRERMTGFDDQIKTHKGRGWIWTTEMTVTRRLALPGLQVEIILGRLEFEELVSYGIETLMKGKRLFLFNKARHLVHGRNREM